MDSPIFIIGNPRSGTTLLRLMLSAHPDIVIAPESGFLQWWYNKYKNWSTMDSSNVKLVNEFINDLKSSRKIENWNLDYYDLKNTILSINPPSYSTLCSFVYLQYAKYVKKESIKYWGDKNNYYIDYLDLIYDLFPYTKFVYIIRDGRDVACSYKDLLSLPPSKYKPKLSTDIEDIAKEWCNNNNRVIEFLNLNDKANSIIIRYEDLVSETKATLTKVCNFLDLCYSVNMETFYDGEIKEPIETLAWKVKTLQKPDSSLIGRFKYLLNPAEIKIFNDLSMPLLNKFNYE